MKSVTIVEANDQQLVQLTNPASQVQIGDLLGSVDHPDVEIIIQRQRRVGGLKSNGTKRTLRNTTTPTAGSTA
jgi:hypothetical protein